MIDNAKTNFNETMQMVMYDIGNDKSQNYSFGKCQTCNANDVILFVFNWSKYTSWDCFNCFMDDIGVDLPNQ